MALPFIVLSRRWARAERRAFTHLVRRQPQALLPAASYIAGVGDLATVFAVILSLVAIFPLSCELMSSMLTTPEHWSGEVGQGIWVAAISFVFAILTGLAVFRRRLGDHDGVARGTHSVAVLYRGYWYRLGGPTIEFRRASALGRVLVDWLRELWRERVDYARHVLFFDELNGALRSARQALGRWLRKRRRH